MPYKKLYDLYRNEVDHSSSQQARLEYELVCAILLDIIFRQEQDNEILRKLNILYDRIVQAR